MRRLSGRVRPSLIFGIQGLPARQLPTLLCLITLFLGALVIDALQAVTARGCCLVLVTHDRDHAARMGRTLDLADGVLTERVPA